MDSKAKRFLAMHQARQHRLKTGTTVGAANVVVSSGSPSQEKEAHWDDLLKERWTPIWDAASCPVSVSMDEVDKLLNELHARWERSRIDDLYDDCRNRTMQSIITTFGIGRLVAAYDKIGGNVDTIHNARHNIYATEEARRRYEEREKYDSYAYHSHENYIAINREYSAQRKTTGIQDAYTGKTLGPNSSMDLDHVVSAKEIHDDPGRVLANLNGPDLANTRTNLAPTSSTINRSKKDKTVDEFLTYRDKKLQEASTSDQPPSPKIQELKDVDADAMRRKDAKAREEIDRTINRTYYTSPEFLGASLKHSAKEAGKMGLYQAVGQLLINFFSEVFREFQDAMQNGWKKGVHANSFLEALGVRFQRIAERVLADWRNILKTAAVGAISGFLSGALTTFANAFVTTGKRAIRLIREGFFSLLQALKCVMFRPENMTPEQARDAAIKIIASAVITAGGIVLEEYLQKALTGLMGSLTILGLHVPAVLSTIFAGALTGLGVALVVYYLDKLDLFGVQAEKRHAFIMDALQKEQAALDAEIDHKLRDALGADWKEEFQLAMAVPKIQLAQ